MPLTTPGADRVLPPQPTDDPRSHRVPDQDRT